MKTVNKWSTHKILISSLFVDFKEKHPERTIDLTPILSSFQSNIRKIYTHVGGINGNDLINHHELFTEDDYEYMVRSLFDSNKYLERSVITIDVHCGGRISEANNLMKKNS